jgi:actin beta/gamma 1
VITSFDDLEFFLHTLWADELRVTIEKYPLLVTLSSLCADPIRERLCEMVMEKFNVPAFYCASPAAMSLYAAGVTSGIVLDSGDAGTVAMPVFQCFSMPYCASRLDVGGRHVNDVIRRGLVQSGYHFAPSAERELLSDMKEHLCFVSDDVATQLPIADKPFMAPDGSGEVKINKETYMGPEVLFNPELIGVDQPGVAKLVENVVRAIDTDIRTDLARTILLAGGSTMFHGFPERLTKELRGIIPDCEFHVVAPPGRKISAWVGGSIIASVGTFNQLWISKREYEETGRSVVHVKTY